MTTNLSPAAQSVLDAFTGNDTIHGLHLMTPRLAAALRAAAEKLGYMIYDYENNEHPSVVNVADILAIADELGGVSKENERPDRLIAGDVWEFETEVMVKGKRKPQDVTLQCVVKGYHPGECAWQLQSLDGQHYVYLWEHAPQYEDMTYIGHLDKDESEGSNG
jgi:hypothetical protein